MKNDKTLIKSELESNFHLLNSNNYCISSYNTDCIDYFLWCPIFDDAPFFVDASKELTKNEKLSLVQGDAPNVPCQNVPKPGTFGDTKVKLRVLSF